MQVTHEAIKAPMNGSNPQRSLIPARADLAITVIQLADMLDEVRRTPDL
jgi:hypothetical protein